MFRRGRGKRSRWSRRISCHRDPLSQHPVDFTVSLESLRALERVVKVSGGGGAEKSSGEDESLIPAASSGFVLRPAHTSRTFTDAEINNLSILAKWAGR